MPITRRRKAGREKAHLPDCNKVFIAEDWVCTWSGWKLTKLGLERAAIVELRPDRPPQL